VTNLGLEGLDEGGGEPSELWEGTERFGKIRVLLFTRLVTTHYATQHFWTWFRFMQNRCTWYYIFGLSYLHKILAGFSS
jgi:hypothetical protein